MPNSSMTDPWEPPAAPADDEPVVTLDPRVDTTHQIGVLPAPSNPPPPVGWKYWIGAVTPEETSLAEKILHDPAQYPMGTFVQTRIGNSVLAARVEWHTEQGKTGNVGCFRGVNLMKPVGLG